jgi:hypothetical protein
MSNLFKFYRLQLIISISLTVVLISQVYRNGYLELSLIILGCLLGTFFLDLDYFISAYLIDTDTDFSRMLKDYIKNKDYSGAFNYIIYHSNEIKNKTLNSAIFQVCLSIFALYIVRNPVSTFYKALVISILLNSIYRFFYFFIQNEHEDWFWILKKTPGKIFIGIYNFLLLIVVGLTIYLYI